MDSEPLSHEAGASQETAGEAGAEETDPETAGEEDVAEGASGGNAEMTEEAE